MLGLRTSHYHSFSPLGTLALTGSPSWDYSSDAQHYHPLAIYLSGEVKCQQCLLSASTSCSVSDLGTAEILSHQPEASCENPCRCFGEKQI